MEELYECLIKLQSYFARPNSQLGPSIEESLRSIFLFLLDLKKLFSSHREYQDLSKSEQNNIIWYLQQVEQYWNSHNEKQQNKKLFDETLTSLRQIIVKHYKNEEQDNNLTYQDLAQELQKKEFQIEVLKMEIDSVTRKQNRESEKQLFQKFSEEMKLLKQINQDLKLSLKEEQQKRISEKKIFDEKQRQFKKIQHKPFEITQLEQENEQLKQFNEQLLNRISNLEEDVKRKQTQELDNKELYRLKSENKRIIDENSSLEQQLTQLYDVLIIMYIRNWIQVNQMNQKIIYNNQKKKQPPLLFNFKSQMMIKKYSLKLMINYQRKLKIQKAENKYKWTYNYYLK